MKAFQKLVVNLKVETFKTVGCLDISENSLNTLKAEVLLAVKTFLSRYQGHTEW